LAFGSEVPSNERDAYGIVRPRGKVARRNGLRRRIWGVARWCEAGHANHDLARYATVVDWLSSTMFACACDDLPAANDR
jgi:hypothetical protein